MLHVKNLSASYGRTAILQDVSFQLRPHTFTAVVGRNGCGKSTLVSCINQQLRYTGEIAFGDKNLALMPPRERAQTVAILPQVLPSPHVTVEQLVLFGRSPYLDLGRRPTQTDWDAVYAAIETTGIHSLKDKTVDELSGGERQKAYLAMILAQGTRVLVLDEPTTYMDMAFEASFLGSLAELKQKQKKTLLVILHDLSQAVRYADQILVVDDHRILFDGSTEACLSSGVLEDVFHVKKHLFTENGEQFVVFSAK